jgi:hypothetical protein
MGLEKLDVKIVKRYFGWIFGHILKVNDMEHHISQIQPDLMILKASKRDMKTLLLNHVTQKMVCLITQAKPRHTANV